MLVSQILKTKGDLVFTVAPTETIAAVAALLHSRRVGALVGVRVGGEGGSGGRGGMRKGEGRGGGAT